LMADASAWTHVHADPQGPVDTGAGNRVDRWDWLLWLARASGVGPRKRIRSVGPSTGARYASASEPLALRRADACERSGRPPTRQRRSTQPRARTTSNDGVAFKCSHHHNLKSYKHWTDGPKLPQRHTHPQPTHQTTTTTRRLIPL
jgi:hypothetical protein